MLLVLGEAGSEGLALKDIAGRMGEQKPAVHRTLMALAKHGFVEQSQNRGDSRLRAFDLRAGLPPRTRRRRRSHKWRTAVMALAGRLGHGVYLMERAGLDAVVLDMQMGTAPIQALTNGVGGRLPMGLGPGSAAARDAGRGHPRLHPQGRSRPLRPARRRSGHSPPDGRTAAETGYGLDLGEIVPSGMPATWRPDRERGGGTTTAISTAVPLSFLSPVNIDLVLREIRAVINAG